METTPPHPFDQALALQAAAPGRWRGHTSAAYWNMVGPFGGITAATLLRAVQLHPDLLGEPLSLTVNYAGPLAEGPFEIVAQPARTNRSTQHWTLSMLQRDPQGADVLTTTATAVTAARRETWSVSDMPMPAVPAPSEVQRVPLFEGVEWVNRYEFRPVHGAIPTVWNGQGEGSETRLWMRDGGGRPLDFCALAAMADIFFPRVWLRRATRVPAGTVSITIYFHAGAARLAETGTGYLLGRVRAQEFRNGFFDHSAQLWNEAGSMLATTHQIVYFKE
ncbi:thioesterase family protein [Ramlibacter sp. H39-3-26]|uniref:acyl-CoA thioesterase n=1 Tax=Curvibacter soli TaxID=3031331 RepID=UPI0023DBC90C|nr:thioesterase family protein [Ramlibacter sp. H39-3-26]MDF1486378.1 thioesterase family protein [Ramlibacter sp. H39-3-26]